MIASACAFALTAQSTFAQNNNPTAADVQRNIEQNKLDLERLSPKPANKKADRSPLFKFTVWKSSSLRPQPPTDPH